ncbi:MAG: M56 family metallopeptidase [Clostridia bacterium]|nr:M56 family metallopeptidase [Clostridia bacterium]
MLFNISVSASILAAAVIVFRLLFKKAPKWIICLLWGLVGLRLVFPFSVESIIGLLPRSNVITDSGTVNTGISAVDEGITRAAYSIATVATPATHSAKTGMGTTAVIGEILFYVWLAGFIVMAVASAVSFIKIRLKVNQSIKLRDNIYICDEIDTPFILGIFRPEIFIPSGLDETKIQSIIAHENSHIHRKDNWWKPLGFLLLSVYWFNPVMWIAYILLCRDIEFACDEKVLKDLTADEIADYSQTLLDCSKPGRLVTVCPLSFGEVGVKQRIKSALSYKKPAFWIIIAALIISAVLAVALSKTIKQRKEEMYQRKNCFRS